MNLKKLFAAAGLALVLFSTPMLRAHEDGDKGGWMKEKLGLTDAQAEKWQAAQKANREAMKTVGQAIKADMKKLHEQLEAKASDAELKGTLNKLEKDGDALRAAELKHRDKVKAILTPTQQAKIALWMGMKMKHQMEGKWEHKDKDEDSEEGEE